MFDFLGRVLAPDTRKAPAQRRTRLNLEQLDDRLVPAVVGLQDGVLVVSGTNGSDTIYISDDYSNNYTVSINGKQVGAVAKPKVWQNTVRIFGSAGNDTIYMGSWIGLRMEAYGGLGDDHIEGGRLADQLFGNDGNDQIYGGDGGDLIRGDGGDDTLLGQNGNDTLLGDAGNDTLYGGAGKDNLYGGIGKDVFYLYFDLDSVFDNGGINKVYWNSKWWKI